MKLSLAGLFDQFQGPKGDTAPATFMIQDTEYETTLADILEDAEFPYPIGEGRFGIVYRKRHRQSNLIVAEKIVTKGTANLDRYAETEKELWKNCRQEHLVNHYGAIDTAMNVHLYFELMMTCFRSVHDILVARAPPYHFPEEVLAKISYNTMSALFYLKHQHSVIHRDIKPSNILIGRDGSVKVTDFGLAKKLVDSRAYTKGIGCLGYISPERINKQDNRGYGTPADVWSIGIMLVELATGKHPILERAKRSNGEYVELEILVAIVDGPAPQLADAQYSEHVRSFANSCLYKEPADRIKIGDNHPFLRSVPTDAAILTWLTKQQLLKS